MQVDHADTSMFVNEGIWVSAGAEMNQSCFCIFSLHFQSLSILLSEMPRGLALFQPSPGFYLLRGPVLVWLQWWKVLKRRTKLFLTSNHINCTLSTLQQLFWPEFTRTWSSMKKMQCLCCDACESQQWWYFSLCFEYSWHCTSAQWLWTLPEADALQIRSLFLRCTLAWDCWNSRWHPWHLVRTSACDIEYSSLRLTLDHVWPPNIPDRNVEQPFIHDMWTRNDSHLCWLYLYAICIHLYAHNFPILIERFIYQYEIYRF